MGIQYTVHTRRAHQQQVVCFKYGMAPWYPLSQRILSPRRTNWVASSIIFTQRISQKLAMPLLMER